MMRSGDGPATALVGWFALHNLEEVWHLPSDVADIEAATGHKLPWMTRPVYATATVELTALVAWALWVGRRRDSAWAEACTLAASSALMGNAATHAVRALARRRYNGGLATAPVLAALAYHVAVASTEHLNPTARRRVSIGANLATVPLILAALHSARRLTSHTQGKNS